MKKPFALIICLVFSASYAWSAETVKFESEIREKLSGPVDLALSSDGHLFVLDDGPTLAVFDADYKLQFYSPIEAPTPPPGQTFNFASIALSPKNQIVAADPLSNRLQVFGIKGESLFAFGAEGPLLGQFKSVLGVDVDVLGFIYAADQKNKRIEIFTPSGVFMRAIAVSGPPVDVAVDPHGSIYALLPESGIIAKFGNDGQKISEIISRHNDADEIAKADHFYVDSWGDIYLTQSTEERIVKIDQNGDVLISFGSEGTERGQFNGITAVLADESGRVYVADKGNARVQIFKISGPQKAPLPKLIASPLFLDFDSTIESGEGVVDIFLRPGKGLFSVADKNGTVSILSSGNDAVIGGAESGAGQLQNPTAVFVALDGKIFVADTGNNRVAIFNPDTSLLYQFGKVGTKPGQFNSPQGIAVNGKGMIYVADTGNNRVQVFNHDGIYLSTIGQGQADNADDTETVCGNVNAPKSIAVDSKDNLYVLDFENAQIKIYDDSGRCRSVFGSKGDELGQFIKPVDLAIDQNDNLYVADAADGRVQIFDPRGRFLLAFGTLGAGGGYFRQLSAISANEGRIYAADYQSRTIQVFRYSPDGLVSRPERLYTTKSAAPPSVEANDVLRYSLARKAAFRAATEEFADSLGFSENYLMRFVRVESIETLNDGNIKVTISIPKYIPKEIVPLANPVTKSGG